MCHEWLSHKTTFASSVVKEEEARINRGIMDADRQIRQMVNFILQEAQEKASEIYLKTEHDFSLEKQYVFPDHSLPKY